MKMSNLYIELIYRDDTPNKKIEYPNYVSGRDSKDKRPIGFTVYGIVDSLKKWEWIYEEVYRYLDPKMGE